MKRSEQPRARRRIDVLLVERGLAPSREKAQAYVLAGLVSAGGQPVAKPGALVPADADLRLAPRPRFVSRGGEKLDGTLAALGLDVTGLDALDVGASTGGFTDCLLKRGAARVVALDVGRGQLDWSLRTDARVTVIEGVNARYLQNDEELGMFDLIVVDVSFISLRLVIPALLSHLRAETVSSRPPRPPANSRPAQDDGRSREAAASASPMSDSPTTSALQPGFSENSQNSGGAVSESAVRRTEEPAPLPALLALVKPQFELGRGAVGRGGIVREPAKHLEAILQVVNALSSAPPFAGHGPAPESSASRQKPQLNGTDSRRRAARNSRKPDPDPRAFSAADRSSSASAEESGREAWRLANEARIRQSDATESARSPDPLSHALGVWAILESPIRGAEGNREFFIHLVPGYRRSASSVEDEARRVAGVSGATDDPV